MQSLRDAKALLLSQILPDPTHSISVSFKFKYDLTSCESKLNFANGATAWFIRVLNDRCLGKSHRRTKKRIGCVVVAEGVRVGSRIHLHLALQKPPHLSEFEFSKKITQSLSKVRHLGNFDNTPYFNGWYKYITKERDSEILIEHCHMSNC